MKKTIILFTLTILLFFFAAPTFAHDFSWTEKLDHKAQVNPTGFRTSLASRFNLSPNQARAVIRKCLSPSDAYMILRLGEIAGKPDNLIVEKYRNIRGKEWDKLALNLGIDHESEEYLALKLDHDLYPRKQGGADTSGPDRALLLMLTRSLCKVETQNKTVW